MTSGKSLSFRTGMILLAGFVIWTILILTVDVQMVGVNGTAVGFSSVNTAFHDLTGVNMTLYTLTCDLINIPYGICIAYGLTLLAQIFLRRDLKKVDRELLILMVYYAVLFFFYWLFKTVALNYRPILIDGKMQASYPSITTVLTLGIMLMLIFFLQHRWTSRILVPLLTVLSGLFAAFMVICRLICGAHWLTDVIGGTLLATGLFFTFRTWMLRAGTPSQSGEENNTSEVS